MRSFCFNCGKRGESFLLAKGAFSTQVGQAVFQLIQLNFTESENPRLCWICYKMVMSLKKAADDLEVKKRELSESEVIDVFSVFQCDRLIKDF